MSRGRGRGSIAAAGLLALLLGASPAGRADGPWSGSLAVVSDYVFRGVLQTYADYDPLAFRRHAVRFSAPVYPGDTVTMEMWKDGNVISFEAKVKARNVAVIKSGKTVLG